jgi:hypothetical protein
MLISTSPTQAASALNLLLTDPFEAIMAYLFIRAHRCQPPFVFLNDLG